jgi:hypothetical protein
MPDRTNRTEKKRELLAAELQRYFDEICPALAARWETIILGLAPLAYARAVFSGCRS